MIVLKLCLINPSNPLVSIVNTKDSMWNRFRVWKPLSLMVLAGLTPPEWEIEIVDENLGPEFRVDYEKMERPDLVGITAFTSQAPRAYEIASIFEGRGVPVVMGGIHATMCADEATGRVGCIVTGEAEGIWADVLSDARLGKLKRRYDGGRAEAGQFRTARHDLLPDKYAFGSIQTTRGCPLNCSFCSVTAFNGAKYRQREIGDVVSEFKEMKEKRILVVDDNLIGTRKEHIERAKRLFRAMIDARVSKEWICQVTINMGDDEELLSLASRAGCAGVFIGFESHEKEGLAELSKKFNLQKGRDMGASVRRIQKHNILVMGSFILGLEIDEPGVGKRIAAAARSWGLDNINVLFLTPLPGTRLFSQLRKQKRLTHDSFPEDWKYYTLTFPLVEYNHLSLEGIMGEMESCNRQFYSLHGIAGRVADSMLHRRKPIISLITNFSYRRNIGVDNKTFAAFSKKFGGPERLFSSRPPS